MILTQGLLFIAWGLILTIALATIPQEIIWVVLIGIWVDLAIVFVVGVLVAIESNNPYGAGLKLVEWIGEFFMKDPPKANEESKSEPGGWR